MVFLVVFIVVLFFLGDLDFVDVVELLFIEV